MYAKWSTYSVADPKSMFLLKMHCTTTKRLRQNTASAVALLAIGGVAIVSVAPATAADDTYGEVWLISTRAAPRCGVGQTPQSGIGYWRLEDGCSWQRTDSEAFFHGPGETVPTIMFVHGNRADASTAVRDGRILARRVRQEASGRTFRFVIWSWPSDRVRGGPRRDARVKAGYTNTQSHYLADCLDRLAPDMPVTLVGYSFGARMIIAALDLLGEGRLAGGELRPQDDPQAPALRRVVLVATAADADWLWPGGQRGSALSQVDRVLVTENRHDPVLKWYPLMYRCGGPQAMGYAGPAGCRCIASIDVLNLTRTVGRNHDWARYAADPRLRCRLGWYCFFEPE